MILAIDPGPERTAIVEYADGRVHLAQIWPNADVLGELRVNRTHNPTVLAVEMIASYGMPVGREVFDTCVWIGRFIEAWGGEHALVYRRDVKLHLCGTARAKDASVRQALLDAWGGKALAVGTKRKPGPLYGLKADLWAALAVAVTYEDQRGRRAA